MSDDTAFLVPLAVVLSMRFPGIDFTIDTGSFFGTGGDVTLNWDSSGATLTPTSPPPQLTRMTIEMVQQLFASGIISAEQARARLGLPEA